MLTEAERQATKKEPGYTKRIPIVKSFLGGLSFPIPTCRTRKSLQEQSLVSCFPELIALPSCLGLSLSFS